MQEDPNYGRSREPGDEVYEAPDEPREIPAGGRVSATDGTGKEVSVQDERTWSILSHVSVLAWPLTGLLPIAPLIVWLLYKDRSPRVGFHALQSLWYQAAWLALSVVGGALATLFVILTFGIGAIVVAPLAAILGIVPFAHQLYAAYRVSQGEDYRYPFIADRIDGGQREL
ncbi:MAG: DUF4870 domain-containing protein [Rubrobacteraceae bacterium]